VVWASSVTGGWARGHGGERTNQKSTFNIQHSTFNHDAVDAKLKLRSMNQCDDKNKNPNK
jgi:hypothetical protein